MDLKSEWMVCVRCYTYNHGPYITDTLDGFTMQKTQFPFVCCIVDDASTDGEQKIIKDYINENFELDRDGAYVKTKEYGTVIFARHKENHNCYFAAVLLNSNHNSTPELKAKKRSYISEWENNCKYEALCEGDDYWIDPFKLQKQIEFLENNPNYSACLTKYISFKESSQSVYAVLGTEYTSLKDMLWRDVQFGTATLVVKYELYKKYQEEIKPGDKKWLMGDKPLVLYMATKGKVRTLQDITTKYRILDSSASHSTNIELQLKRARNTIDIYHYFADRYLSGDMELSKMIEGGYLYRAYKIYQTSNKIIPNTLKCEIFKYDGQYPKIKIVKILLRLPFLQSLVYKIAGMKNKIGYLLKK